METPHEIVIPHQIRRGICINVKAPCLTLNPQKNKKENVTIQDWVKRINLEIHLKSQKQLS